MTSKLLIDKIIDEAWNIVSDINCSDNYVHFGEHNMMFCSPKVYHDLSKDINDEIEKRKTLKKFNKDLKDTIDG